MASCSNFNVSFSSFRLAPLAWAALVAGAASAQTATLEPVTVTGRDTPAAQVSGWGDIPLTLAPLSATLINESQMRDLGVRRLADVARADASVSDAYNSEGYWDNLTVRGFTIDNRFNYRRDGLPISAETALPLDNKERIEVLKGVSGIQAGTSAPGGLVNLVVKRPGAAPVRSVQLGWREPGSYLAAADLSQRFGEEQSVGIRVNAAHERLSPAVRNARGERHLVAVAADWQATRNTLVEAEFETSRRSQPSQAAFSILGNVVPSPGDPRINLNNQPWSQPVVMDANTASLRVTHHLSADWRLSAHAATQQLKTDDRMAYPFGCSAENNWAAFCSDGTFDLYDFRSEGEKRRTDALELAAHGAFQTGTLRHSASAGVLQSRVKNRFQRQAYNWTGIGTIDGNAITPEDPALTDENTHRDERSTELFLRDAVQLTDNLTAWFGVRHTRLHRESIRTDGSRPTDYAQDFVTPALALSYQFAPRQLVYASWGRGVESEVVANRPRFANAGEGLSGKSEQAEIGIKVAGDSAQWAVAFFDIERPHWGNAGACDDDLTPGSCTRLADGTARHRGLEANAGWRTGAWAFQTGVQVLQARRHGAGNAGINGKNPINVPARTVKLQARYDVPAWQGLSLQANALGVSHRAVTDDNSLRIPGYGVADVSARYHHRIGQTDATWRAGIDNLFDKRAWRESPFQFEHVYLYPLAGRAMRVSLELDF